MAGRTLIHVGLPKTGSTFLQQRVFPTLERTYFSNKRCRELRRLLYTNDTSQHDALRDLARQLRKRQHLLISNEGLFGEPQHSFQYHHGFAVRLRELFPDAEILLVVRRQDTYAESMYRQVIQQGWHHRLDQFLLRDRDREHRRWYPHLYVDDLDWCRYYRSYRSMFGDDRVHLMVFEDLVRDQEGFLRELELLIGEPLAVREGRENRSLSATSVAIARRLNRLYRYDNRLGGVLPVQRAYRAAKSDGRAGRAAWIRRLLPRYFLPSLVDRNRRGSGRLMPDDVAAHILGRHDRGNRELASLSGRDLGAHGYYAAR